MSNKSPQLSPFFFCGILKTLATNRALHFSTVFISLYARGDEVKEEVRENNHY
jgi:hypothetical protein